jgi:cytochrome P450
LFGRASILYSQKVTLDGTLPIWIHKLHLKHGPVVRYAPNEISFIDADVWKDIHGHRANAFPKDMRFYGPDAYGKPPGMLRADDVNHARQRKLVSYAFSDKALRDQQPLLKGYVRLLIERLKETSAKGGETDMVKWYNFTAFDIMADLTFGEPLKLLQDSKYTPWVDSVFAHAKMIVLTQVIRSWGLSKFVQMCMPLKTAQKRKVHMEHSSTRVDARLSKKTDRPDIWTNVLKHSEDEEHKGKGLQPTEMHSNGALFMLAGTETTATSLCGLTYYLLKNPTKLARLQKEIRATFSSLDDMHITELAQLPYLQACIDEGLRIYPPVSIGLHRNTPRGGAMVAGHWVPGGVR